VTVEEAGQLTGQSVEDIRRWQELGLLNEGDELSVEDVERVRLIGFAGRRGVAPADLARINEVQGDLLDVFVRWATRPGQDVLYSRDELAERAGLEPELLDRILSAAGLRDRSYGYEDDLEALELVNTALKFGFPDEALIQILRVVSDSLAKASEAMVRVFHIYVHERFRAEGLSGAELLATTQSLADPMSELVEPMIVYFHRRSWERANREDMLLHLLEETAPPSAVPGELVRTILFVDLSSFTPLTEAMGDAAAARIIERFSDMVRDTAAGCDGQVLKQIGDEFMLVFPDPARAVTFGVGIQAAATAEPRFPALRIGAHVGPVLYREGDYLGANVNLAARVTSASSRNQFAVTDAVRHAVDDPECEFVSLGPRSLKGVGEAVELFAVRKGSRVSRVPDPVCGMELDESTAEANLTWEGQRLLFCSEACLRRFLDNPGRYQVEPSGG
jgi:class 3 adenylate cyclase/DNA-binding transcriptional MerR regulator